MGGCIGGDEASSPEEVFVETVGIRPGHLGEE